MSHRRQPTLFAMLIGLLLAAGTAFAQDEGGPAAADTLPAPAMTADKYVGYFAREDNGDKLGRETGHSHYIKFYPELRIARLYIPWPYGGTLTPATIDAAFDKTVAETAGSAFIRGEFGVLEENATAHLDFVKDIDGELMFDCGRTHPCRIVFTDTGLEVIKKGIVKDHTTVYNKVEVK